MTEAPARDRLNLGCGRDVDADWVNLDLAPLPGVDVVHDLAELPLPFPDNSFAEIKCVHILEHLPNFTEVVADLHRILAVGGRLCVQSPHFTAYTTWVDPTHVRTFSMFTFDFFVRGTDLHSERDYYAPFAFSGYERRYLRFRRSRFEPWNRLAERIINRSERRILLYERTGLRSLFPADSVDLVLVK